MLSTLARTLGVVPGGLGVFEAVSVTTLKLIGVPVAAGLAATLLFRFFTFWLPMAPGVISRGVRRGADGDCILLGEPLPALEGKCQGGARPKKVSRHVKPGRCHTELSSVRSRN